MDDSKRVANLSVEELKEIVKEALVEALGVKGIEKASGNEECNSLEEEFRLNLFEDDEGGVA